MEMISGLRSKIPAPPEIPQFPKVGGEDGESSAFSNLSSMVPPVPGGDLGSLASFTPPVGLPSAAGLMSAAPFGLRSSAVTDPRARNGPEVCFRRVPLYHPRIYYKSRGKYEMGPGLHPRANKYKVHDTFNIPGRGDCSLYRAKFVYNPSTDSPNQTYEKELKLQVGDILLVWQESEDNYLVGEQLLTGKSGFVPSNYLDRLTGTKLLDFFYNFIKGYLIIHPEDPFNCLFDHEFENPDVPAAPRDLTAKLDDKFWVIKWKAPAPLPDGLETFHVFLNGLIRCCVKVKEEPRALIQRLDLDKAYRVSVRSIFASGKSSPDSACTLVFGSDAFVNPVSVKIRDIRGTTATIWCFPARNGLQHDVFVNEQFVATLEVGVYKFPLTGLHMSTEYQVGVSSRLLLDPNPNPDPLEMEEETAEPESEISPPTCITFKTLDKDFLPPSNIIIEPDLENKVMALSWNLVRHRKIYIKGKPVPNAVDVTGYVILVNGIVVCEVDSASVNQATVDLNHSAIQFRGTNTVTMRTKYGQEVSGDSETKSFSLNPAQRKKQVTISNTVRQTAI